MQNSKSYLPFYALNDAKDFAKNYKNSTLLCGKLASLSTTAQEEFFENLHKNSEDNFLFYDLILPERNIYYPSQFIHACYVKSNIGNNKYKSYMKQGALLGLLHKNNFSIQSSSIRFMGAFAAVLATKS